jgi:hypothetical protein
MSVLDPQHQPSPVAEAPCTPDERREVEKHAGKKILVNGKPAVISPSFPITGDPSDRIRVTFPPDASEFLDAPPEVQAIIDRMDFTPIS